MPATVYTAEEVDALFEAKLKPLYEAINKLSAGEQPKPVDPEQPKPEEPKPAEPKVIHTFSLDAGKAHEWDQGFSVQSQRLSVADTPANRAAIVTGNQLRFVDGTVVNITAAPASHNRIWPEYGGDKMLSGAKLGAPNKVEVLSGVAVAPVPKPDDDPSVPDNLPKPPIVEEPPPVKPAPPAYMNGVNLSGAQFSHGKLPGSHNTDYVWAGADWYNHYKKLGCYLFRVGFFWERMQLTLGGPINETEVAYLITAMKACKANGQKIIPEAHNYGRHRDKVIGATGGPTYAQYADFCAKLIARLKKEPSYDAIYAYGLMNEPYGDADKHTFAAYQAAITAIAKVDDELPLAVCGMSYGSGARWPTYSDPLKNLIHPKGKSKLIMEFHQYIDPDASGTYANRNEQFDPQIGVNRVKPAIDWCKKHGFPMFLGEYGMPPDNLSAQVANRNMIDYCNANGVMTTIWCAGPWWTEGNVTALDVSRGPAGIGPLKSQLTFAMPFFTVQG